MGKKIKEFELVFTAIKAAEDKLFLNTGLELNKNHYKNSINDFKKLCELFDFIEEGEIICSLIEERDGAFTDQLFEDCANTDVDEYNADFLRGVLKRAKIRSIIL